MRGKNGRAAWIVAALVFIAAAFLLQEHIDAMRRAGRLGEEGLSRLPPGELAGTLLLGGFRAVAVDALWIRVENQNREGNYYEVISLCKLIGELEPHFAEVWRYNAWNMAQNIARQAETDEGKWEWTRAAIQYIREGERRNPGDWETIHLEGWLFEHCVARSGFLSRKAEEEFGLNPHALAIQCFRKHVEFGDDAVLPPYRRCVGDSYRAWGDDLRREALLLRQERGNAVESGGPAKARERPDKELLLLRQALARYWDAYSDWQDLMEMAQERLRGPASPSSGYWKAFAADTRKLMAEVLDDAKQTLEEIRADTQATKAKG